MAVETVKKEDIDMEKYRLKRRPRNQEKDDEKPDNEIRITSHGRVTTYVQYAFKVFGEQEADEIILKATGQALSNAVTVAEVLKRRFKGLHQQNKIGSREVHDEYEPIKDKDLETMSVSRYVSYIEIVLNKKDDVLDTKAKGYQAPIDESLVEEYDPEKHDRTRGGKRSSEGDDDSDSDEDEKPKRKGKGKGKKGKGKGGKGKGKKGDSKGKGKGKGKKGKGKGKGKRSRSGSD